MPRSPHSRLFLRVDQGTRDRLEALRELAHETNITQTIRRLIHTAYDKHDCRGQGCPVCSHRVAELAAGGAS